MVIEKGSGENAVGQGISDELVEYIRDGLRKGYHLGEIRKFLIKEGVREELVDRAMEGFSKGAGWKNWIGTFFIITAIFLIIAIAGTLGYYVIGGFGGGEVDIRVDGVSGGGSEVGNIIELRTEALIKRDSGICDGIEIIEEKILCKINTNARLGDDSYCKELLEEGSNYNDLCWFSLVEINKVDKCDKIKSERIKEECRRILL